MLHSQNPHPLGRRARILLTSVFGPYAQDDEYGSRRINPMELYHNQVTRVQGAFSLRMHHRSIGLLLIQDSETGEQVFVDTHDKGFRRRFRELAATREAELRTAFQQAGVDALELATDDDLVDAIVRFADLRKRRSQLACGGGMPQHMGVL